MISYEGLENTLKAKGIGKTELSKQLGLSTRTVAYADTYYDHRGYHCITRRV